MRSITLLAPWSSFHSAHFQLCASPLPSLVIAHYPVFSFYSVSQLLFHFKPWTLFSLCLILPIYCSCWSEDFKPKLGKFSFARWQFLQCPGRGGVVTIPHSWAVPECWWWGGGAAVPVVLPQDPVCAHIVCRFSCHLLLFCGCRKLRQRHQKAETAGRVRTVALLGQCCVQGFFCVFFCWCRVFLDKATWNSP